MMLMLAIGGWFAQQVWEGQKRIVDRLNTMDIDRASVAASRFTASDWTAAKSAIDNQFNVNERRIFKLESTADQINRSLDRIENRLGTKDK
jgi:hypothetical protein